MLTLQVSLFEFFVIQSPTAVPANFFVPGVDPHKVTDGLQDERLYVLDAGQKVDFERLKKNVPAPFDWAAQTRTWQLSHIRL